MTARKSRRVDVVVCVDANSELRNLTSTIKPRGVIHVRILAARRSLSVMHCLSTNAYTLVDTSTIHIHLHC